MLKHFKISDITYVRSTEFLCEPVYFQSIMYMQAHAKNKAYRLLKRKITVRTIAIGRLGKKLLK